MPIPVKYFISVSQLFVSWLILRIFSLSSNLMLCYNGVCKMTILAQLPVCSKARNRYFARNRSSIFFFFRRFIFAKLRFDFIEGRKNSLEAATPSPFCAISLLFPTNLRMRFGEKQASFRRLKLPKRTREKRIFRHLRNLTTVKSEVLSKD